MSEILPVSRLLRAFAIIVLLVGAGCVGLGNSSDLGPAETPTEDDEYDITLTPTPETTATLTPTATATPTPTPTPTPTATPERTLEEKRVWFAEDYVRIINNRFEVTNITRWELHDEHETLIIYHTVNSSEPEMMDAIILQSYSFTALNYTKDGFKDFVPLRMVFTPVQRGDNGDRWATVTRNESLRYARDHKAPGPDQLGYLWLFVQAFDETCSDSDLPDDGEFPWQQNDSIHSQSYCDHAAEPVNESEG